MTEPSGQPSLSFTDFYHALGCASSVEPLLSLAFPWWERVRIAYDGERQRHYHTLAHLEDMWRAYMQWCSEDPDLALSDEDRPVLLFAILFHDVVYDPRAGGGKNERDSVAVWEQCAKELKVLDSVAARTTRLILATIDHRIPDDGEDYPACLPLFLDLDLEVLSRPRAEYAEYGNQIREEYSHVSTQDYCKGRIAVLRSLSQGDIYFTNYCRMKLRDSARENIEWEIDQLKAHAALS